METNIKVVGFADQSINGVTIKNQGFDLDYDGKIMNMSGFSGDKLYYAKLNNQQLMSLLQLPSSDIPLEQRIMNYKQAPQKRKIIIYKPHSTKHKTPKRIKTLKIVKIKSPSSHKSKSYKSRYRTPTPYFTPKMRSEYKKSIKTHSARTKTKPKSRSSSTRSSKSKTIY